jgi:hypothetical protein
VDRGKRGVEGRELTAEVRLARARRLVGRKIDGRTALEQEIADRDGLRVNGLLQRPRDVLEADEIARAGSEVAQFGAGLGEGHRLDDDGSHDADQQDGQQAGPDGEVAHRGLHA